MNYLSSLVMSEQNELFWNPLSNELVGSLRSCIYVCYVTQYFHPDSWSFSVPRAFGPIAMTTTRWQVSVGQTDISGTWTATRHPSIPEPTESIPEPTSTLGLLALGVLGTGSRFKCSRNS